MHFVDEIFRNPIKPIFFWTNHRLEFLLITCSGIHFCTHSSSCSYKLYVGLLFSFSISHYVPPSIGLEINMKEKQPLKKHKKENTSPLKIPPISPIFGVTLLCLFMILIAPSFHVHTLPGSCQACFIERCFPFSLENKLLGAVEMVYVGSTCFSVTVFVFGEQSQKSHLRT